MCILHMISTLTFIGSWGNFTGSAVKNFSCSFGGTGLDSQHPHGGSLVSLTPIPVYLTPSSFLGLFMKMMHRYTFIQIFVHLK